MTAGGDAVLAYAYTWVGQPNGDPFWQWWGADLGSYCACFVSFCGAHAGYPVCPIDGSGGFVLVSNGTIHSYEEGEAKPTLDLQPGDIILFSWYYWDWQNGFPVITEDPWVGWIAGDHTGLFSHWIDQSTGQFATVEGNTSGGVVAYRDDRYASQVCGWWRTPSVEGSWTPDTEPPPAPLPSSVERDDMFIMWSDKGAVLIAAGYQKWLTGDEVDALSKVPGMVSYTAPSQFEFDCIGGATFNGTSAPVFGADPPTVAGAVWSHLLDSLVSGQQATAGQLLQYTNKNTEP